MKPSILTMLLIFAASTVTFIGCKKEGEGEAPATDGATEGAPAEGGEEGHSDE